MYKQQSSLGFTKRDETYPLGDLCVSVSSLSHDCQKWGQPTCPQKMEYSSAAKGSRLLICSALWMTFRSTMLSERSQTQYCMSHFP